jgi:mono/diheme cytochrome c family protein
MAKRWSSGSRASKLVLSALPLAVILGAAGGYELTREGPAEPGGPLEEFEYGSLGDDSARALPYWVWYVLPRVFGDLLPGNGGYAAFGFTWERQRTSGPDCDAAAPADRCFQGSETPIGFAKTTEGTPRISTNCALCHTATYRLRPEDPPTAVPGGAAQQADIQAYQQFLYDCAADPRFNPDTLISEIGYNVKLSVVDEWKYRYVIIPRTKRALLEQRAASRWIDTRPRWGPGRADAFGQVEVERLGMPADAPVGATDHPSIWQLAARPGQGLYADGMTDNLHEAVLGEALRNGSTSKGVELARLDRIEKWLREAKPPAYPAPIDQPLAARGQKLFSSLCNDCHGAGSAAPRSVVAIADIGTDPERHRLWTDDAAGRYRDLAAKQGWSFEHVRGTAGPEGGYVARPLAGVWSSAPYLHNGSVPSLADLLAEPYGSAGPPELERVGKDLSTASRVDRRARSEEVAAVERLVRRAREEGRRPPVFFRGYDLLDTEHAGFAADVGSVPDETPPFVYDTRLAGNGNGGHVGPRYGTELPPDDKRALIEYLKTL